MRPFKVLVVQNIPEIGYKMLKEAGFEVVIPENLEDETLEELAAECDGMLVRTRNIPRGLIEKAKKLKVIARSGVGYDNVDIQAAAQRGIYVCNVPQSNSNSVAEQVVGMMISLAHQILKADKALRMNQFGVRDLYIGSELKGKTLGLIGFGSIGQLTAKKCGLGLDMNVMAYDPYFKNEEEFDYVEFVSSIDLLLSESDFVSLHLPYSSDLHHFIGEKELNKMKSSAFLINCARGGLVDEKALYDAIKNARISGAGLDVFEEEPPKKDHFLWELENIIVTPHMAAHTKDSLEAMASGAAKEIINVLSGEHPRNCVNKHLFTKEMNL
ncbi:hydroxyacid dehydrogenase [Bacillus sp. ISL-47]|uniref:hydroxyacid dehydrogenase n=1 Tax=Bacillus sp. ISL-47 TaxID=2819130 RepID=UPI001BECDFE7|nr:hydroxyacid dehydrogenase [Bacillus sp. ISL-47]MBT2686717.1 hydroxyacid dehydrogenase [Bacillus sp. ISL-47]MBT2706935.1 hydroxyacid dehydrogenase [Pseudomonas sp. ISL-84]